MLNTKVSVIGWRILIQTELKTDAQPENPDQWQPTFI